MQPRFFIFYKLRLLKNVHFRYKKNIFKINFQDDEDEDEDDEDEDEEDGEEEEEEEEPGKTELSSSFLKLTFLFI